MNIVLRFGFVIVAAVSVSGCANLLSIHRQHNITPASGSVVGGAEITLIDAKQRAIISVQRKSKTAGQDKVVVCAEPSPDALQAVAASTAFSVRDAEDRLAQIANSLSESASNIGLRTQSIQLLRDAMFRICEGYAAHAIDDDEVTSLHRRYQNLMLGLLAIEQLTGAVATSQVALFTNGAATAGAAATELAAAQQKVKTEQDAHAEAVRLQQVAEGELRKIETDLKTARLELAKVKSDDKEKAKPLQDQITDLSTQENQKQAEVQALRTKASNQFVLVKAAETALQGAAGKVTASTAAQASFDGRQGRGLNDPATAGAVAAAVGNIISTIVTQSFVHEACFGYVEKMMKATKASATSSQYDSISKISAACMENLAAQFAKSTELLKNETQLLQQKRTDPSR